jgi:Protein of unknown function (DUF2726)
LPLSSSRNAVSGVARTVLALLRKATAFSTRQVLYHRLITALPEHIILAQVQVSRVLGVKKGFNFNEWNNRINRLSYDFVVCTKDLTVLAAVELDDKSHETRSCAETDGKKDRATTAAGVRLIRWNVKSLPDQVAIQAAFPTKQPDHFIEQTGCESSRALDQFRSQMITTERAAYRRSTN